MLKFATLSLHELPDSQAWETGCLRLGMQKVASVISLKPTFEQIAEVFSSGAQWLYIGGHYYPGDFKVTNHDGDVSVVIHPDMVVIKTPESAGEIRRDSLEFNLDYSLVLTCFRACNVCSNSSTVRALRQLFGPHAMLTFDYKIGWEMAYDMFGAGNPKFRKHFFANLANGGIHLADSHDRAVDAWMKAAVNWYATSELEETFVAVNMRGEEFRLNGRSIVKVRTHP